MKETTSKKEGLTFFDNLKDDLRCNHAYYKSITLPGIVAFLYYSGSLTFIFLSLAIISILFCILEFYLVIISYRNFIFVSLIGQILAYRLWHFGFAPLNSIKLLVAIFLTTIIIYLANKLITKL